MSSRVIPGPFEPTELAYRYGDVLCGQCKKLMALLDGFKASYITKYETDVLFWLVCPCGNAFRIEESEEDLLIGAITISG